MPVKMLDLALKKKREEWIKHKNMRVFNLFNLAWPISEIDIVIDSPIDYQKAAQNIKKILLKNVSIPTISKKDLIIMKQASNRRQDKDDIRHLKYIKIK